MITKTDLDRVLGEHFGHEGDHLRVGDHRSYKTVVTRNELEDFLVQYAGS